MLFVLPLSQQFRYHLGTVDQSNTPQLVLGCLSAKGVYHEDSQHSAAHDEVSGNNMGHCQHDGGHKFHALRIGADRLLLAPYPHHSSEIQSHEQQLDSQIRNAA